jgi:hypothetical protein
MRSLLRFTPITNIKISFQLIKEYGPVGVIKEKAGRKMTLLILFEKLFGITFFSSSTKSN